MIVRAVLFFMLVFMLVRIASVGMLVRMLMLMFVFVDVVVFVSVRNTIVGVLMGMGMRMSVFVLVAMIVFAFHRIPSIFLAGYETGLEQPNHSAT
jgi:uncharacterized membrane protein